MQVNRQPAKTGGLLSQRPAASALTHIAGEKMSTWVHVGEPVGSGVGEAVGAVVGSAVGAGEVQCPQVSGQRRASSGTAQVRPLYMKNNRSGHKIRTPSLVWPVPVSAHSVGQPQTVGQLIAILS